MEIKVIASTKPGETIDKKEFNKFSGHVAGICYMSSSFEDILNEDEGKTMQRCELTQKSGHHSVFDHEYISLYLDGIPKLLAMLLNNEKMYTTSEKSARYTKMQPTEMEKKLYNKWMETYRSKISETYPQFDTKKVEKLSKENARYLISVMTPTKMVYTVSYRQINYLYRWIKKIVENPKSKLEELLKESLEEFSLLLESIGYIEKNLTSDQKERELSLIEIDNKKRTELFGDVYCTNYSGSFAQVAQAHRHRTLSYSISLLDEQRFFIPPIIADDRQLVVEWLEDMKKVAHVYPQGMLVSINERGTYENIVLKFKERLCTHAQLEIAIQTRETLLKYQRVLQESDHYLKDNIKNYTKGARCTFPDYSCPTDCGFKEGKTLVRKI